MGLFDRKPESNQQRGQPRISFRLLGCVVLGYIAIGMLRPTPENLEIDPFFRIGIGSAFLVFALIIAGFTLRDYIRVRQAQKIEAEKSVSEEGSADTTKELQEPEFDEADGDDEDSEC